MELQSGLDARRNIRETRAILRVADNAEALAKRPEVVQETEATAGACFRRVQRILKERQAARLVRRIVRGA